MGLQLTRGSEYGIRAMMYLAGREPGTVCSLHDVGQDEDIPESFLAKVFQRLTRAGLVASRRGARGGFTLLRPPGEITVAAIIQAVDGPVSLNPCVLWPETCGLVNQCTMHPYWVRAQEVMMGVLEQATLADLVPPAARSAREAARS